MKRLLLFIGLCVFATAANAAVVMSSVEITGTGADEDNRASSCAGFTLSPRKVARFFSKSVPVDSYELHDHYLWGPCFIRGTAQIDGNATMWEIRVGGTGSYSAPDGSIQSVANPRERVDVH